MLFTFMCGIIRVILSMINRNTHYEDKEKLPKDRNYVLVAPHQTWWEPLYLTTTSSPKKFNFMAKKELFRNPVLCLVLKHTSAFPVGREKPGSNTIKIPVRILRNSGLSLIMFPSGTHHSSELKDGVTLIARIGRVPIVPSVYQGPLTLKELLRRKEVTVHFGEPIDISDIKKMDKDGLVGVERRMRETFDRLDREIDPIFKYESTEKE